MIDLSRKIASFFLKTANSSSESTTLKERYKQFRVSLIFAISIIALIPSTLLAILSYFQYLDLVQQQSVQQIQWHLQHMKTTLDNHLEEISEFLKNSAEKYNVTTARGENLELFEDAMKERIQGLVHIRLRPDLTLAVLEEYPLSLPANFLKSQNHQFGIGFSVSSNSGDENHNYIATLEIRRLENVLNQVNSGAVEDAFLMTRLGIIATHSSYYGSRNNRYPLSVQRKTEYLATTDKKWGMGKTLYASTPLAGSPWILVLIKDGPIQKKEWLTFQLTLFFIFFACATGSYIVILQLVNLLTLRIRESDTKRMALLNEVGHTNRLATIGKLAAGVAHEINNPLAVIDQKTGLIQDLLELSDAFTNKEKIHFSLEGIQTSVERCKVITHRLLGFARKVDLEKEQLNINTIIQEVMGFLEKEALYSHIIFEMELMKDLPEIRSDRGQLQQIFLNIISNSIDAIGSNGIIRITTSAVSKKKILVKIEDNGPGIKPQVMEHIFDPFFTTKETGKGTGLGLSITYGLVKKLGGDIKVHSVVNEGVTFFIYLPTTFARKKED